MAWNILFMLTCTQSTLPWNNVNSKYGNTEQTILSRINKYFHDEIVYNIKDISQISYSEFYFPLVVCFLFCWIIIFMSLYLGFNNSRKLMYGTMIYVVGFLVFALTRVYFLPNAFDGLKYCSDCRVLASVCASSEPSGYIWFSINDFPSAFFCYLKNIPILD